MTNCCYTYHLGQTPTLAACEGGSMESSAYHGSGLPGVQVSCLSSREFMAEQWSRSFSFPGFESKIQSFPGDRY